MSKNDNAATKNVGSYDPAHALTVNDLMERWQMSRKRILEAIKERRLTAFKVGKRVYRITLDEVLRFEKARAA
jgi:hypothetical protein